MEITKLYENFFDKNNMDKPYQNTFMYISDLFYMFDGYIQVALVLQSGEYDIKDELITDISKMKNHIDTVISDVSSGLVSLLSTSLVPEIIPNRNQIFLGNPKENPRASLCIYLYDVKEERGIQGNSMISEGINTQRFPSVYLTLRYMITALSSSEGKFRALEEQKILGRVIQIFNENRVLNNTNYEATKDNDPANIRVTFQNMELDEKIKIFQTQDMPYKVSLFYSVSLVELQSRKEKDISRVSDYDMNYV